MQKKGKKLLDLYWGMRKPLPPSTKRHKSKNKYNRKKGFTEDE